jgi:hypothetical protein
LAKGVFCCQHGFVLVCVAESSRSEFTEHISDVSSYCEGGLYFSFQFFLMIQQYSSGYSHFLAGCLEPQILGDDNPRDSDKVS